MSDAIEAFFEIDDFAKQPDTFAIFYSPNKCFLARLEKGRPMMAAAKDHEPTELSSYELKRVFEARVFNTVSEMRWLNDTNGSHITAVISEMPQTFDGNQLQNNLKVIGVIDPDQEYLLWGQSTGKTKSNWTQFATARIGAFYIPVPNVPPKGYARFKAVEYLKTYKDGNVAVVDERLIGIEGC